MKIIIVVLAFNEENRISGVLRGLKKTNYSVVVVDDGSTDTTSLKLRSANKTTNVTVLRHKVNLGKGAAMKTGAEAAFLMGADAVIFMDGDGQHSASDLPRIKKALNEGFEIVFGSRNLSHGVPLVRYLGNKAASILVAKLFGLYVSDILCGFRAVTKEAYSKIKWGSRGYGVEIEMVVRSAKSKIKSCEVPVTTLYYDKFKGVSILDSFGVFLNIIRWRLRK